MECVTAVDGLLFEGAMTYKRGRNDLTELACHRRQVDGSLRNTSPLPNSKIPQIQCPQDTFLMDMTKLANLDS